MTHHIYWVWVEVYSDHFYAEKFHLKEHKDSPRKYKLLTGLNEVRPVVNTCIAVLREIAEKDHPETIVRVSERFIQMYDYFE